MVTMNIQSIQQFIATHRLERVDGNILFNATISFYQSDTLHIINSPVQVIVLPNEMAIYILEFLNEEYNITEMYSTGQYYFTFPDLTALEIRDSNPNHTLLISILPV
jgi:hypothetical protein